jgi:hypothetical protein
MRGIEARRLVTAFANIWEFDTPHRL